MHQSIRALICAAAMLVPALATAQAYPSKPVRIIVPFPAGGPADLFGRALAQGMTGSLGQPVIIENRAGVGGVLGVDNVAKAPPDGTCRVEQRLGGGDRAFSMEKMPTIRRRTSR
jgi:tripartite-type tricarboxylate transporter receptor subunit TctC